jgi:DNA-binding response OmpR family regulator
MDVKNDLGGGKPTLLIAEDEESNYLLLKTILHKYCNLIRAKTEMTGIESLKEIRKLSKDIPVIMQSAYVFDSDMEAAKEAGASGFITKPINLKVLKNTISQYCPSIVW